LNDAARTAFIFRGFAAVAFRSAASPSIKARLLPPKKSKTSAVHNHYPFTRNLPATCLSGLPTSLRYPLFSSIREPHSWTA
jgi:hypothetical protein